MSLDWKWVPKFKTLKEKAYVSLNLTYVIKKQIQIVLPNDQQPFSQGENKQSGES